MSEFKINKPWLYKDKWLIFPDTIFSELDLTDCNDTVKGICTTGQTLEQCIESCAITDGYCGAGYFIERKDGNICVPIRTGIHKFLNQAFRLRNKSLYPVMKDMKVSTFIDRSIFPFPPDIPNATFYQDPFFLENVETGMKVELPPKDLIDVTRIQFTDSDQTVNIQLLPVRNTMYTNQVYIPVRHVEPVIINIPGTSLVMRKNANNNYIGWAPRLTAIAQSENTFKIYPTKLKKTKKKFQILNYDEEIYITYQDLYIIEYDPKYNTIKAIYSTYENAKADGRNITFRLRPNIQAYFCKDLKCHTVNLKDTDMDDLKATYQGNHIVRNPECWGMCKYKDANDLLTFSDYPSKSHGKTWLIIMGVLVIIGVIVWLRRT